MDEFSIDILVDAGFGAVPDAQQFTVTSSGTSVEVTALVGVGTDDLLVVATPDGNSAAAYGEANGQSTVVVESSSNEVWVWIQSLAGAGATGCIALPL